MKQECVLCGDRGDKGELTKYMLKVDMGAQFKPDPLYFHACARHKFSRDALAGFNPKQLFEEDAPNKGAGDKAKDLFNF